METQPAFGTKELFTHVVGDMAKAVAERNGETKQQQGVRTQAAVHMILGFLPRDVIEAMLAGHCVMFHAVMTDSVHETLRGEIDTIRQSTRGNLVALNKAFIGNLDRLRRYQLRPSEGQRDIVKVQPANAQAAPPPAHPVIAEAPAAEVPGPAPIAQPGDAPVVFDSSAEAIAACRANPEAVAALDAGDSGRPARAIGIDMQAEAFPGAAAQGSVFYHRPTVVGTKEPGVSSQVFRRAASHQAMAGVAGARRDGAGSKTR